MAQTQGLDRVVVNMMVRYGTVAYIVVPSETGVYNPDTSAFTPNPSRSYKVNAFAVDFPLRKDGIKDDANTVIQTADKMLYVQPYKDVPLPLLNPAKDKVKIGNEVWKIVGVKEENPTLDNPIVLILYIKR